MTDPHRLAALCQVTALALQAAQAEMAAMCRAEEALRQKLEALIADRQAQSKAALSRGAATPLAGADLRWHGWIDQRRAAINLELARLTAEKEALTTKLRHSFGKDQAAQALLAGAQKQFRQRAERRDT